MLDPSVRLHPYLFEHHPERNLWSFRKTFASTFRPRRFWSRVHPLQQSKPRRIVYYWGVFCVFLLFVLMVHSVFVAIAWHRSHTQLRANNLARITTWTVPRHSELIIDEYGSVDSFIEQMQSSIHQMYPTDTGFLVGKSLEYILENLPAVLAIIAIPWITVLSLLIFRVSMRRARIRSVHVVRAVLYGQSVTLAAFALVSALGMVAPHLGPPTTARLLPLNILIGVVALYGILAGFYGVFVAYRDYLRFDRPLWTVLAGYAITAMILINLGLLYNNWE